MFKEEGTVLYQQGCHERLQLMAENYAFHVVSFLLVSCLVHVVAVLMGCCLARVKGQYQELT